jgi:hypothetical protein
MQKHKETVVSVWFSLKSIQQRRPKVVNEVDDETLDVRAVMILICLLIGKDAKLELAKVMDKNQEKVNTHHDHQMTISQCSDVLLCVGSTKLQTHDLDQVHNL